MDRSAIWVLPFMKPINEYYHQSDWALLPLMRLGNIIILLSMGMGNEHHNQWGWVTSITMRLSNEYYHEAE